VPARPDHPHRRLARATTKLGLANLVTNMRRLAWFELRPAPA
jgi:hypothetical protein